MPDIILCIGRYAYHTSYMYDLLAFQFENQQFSGLKVILSSQVAKYPRPVDLLLLINRDIVYV